MKTKKTSKLFYERNEAAGNNTAAMTAASATFLPAADMPGK